MKYLLFLVIPLLLCAEPPQSSISSKNASYNGNKLFLEGDVKLDHEFGQMSASEAYLEKDDKMKEFLFSLIHLQKNVLLHLKNHGQILCEVADLNFNTLKGKFFPKKDEKIIYTELLERVKGDPAVLKLLSNLAEVKISKNEQDYKVEEVEALKDVLVEYGKDFLLKADRAIYQERDKNPRITTFPADDSYCTLSHLKDELKAKQIQFDLKELKLTLKETFGTLVSVLFPKVQKEAIKFKAGELIWDYARGILRLRGGAFVEEGAFASMETEDEIELKEVVQNKKRKIKTIIAKGNTNLKYAEPETNHVHQLYCYGPISVDRETLHAVLESPKSEGIVAEERQIAYEHDLMAIRANRADVHYKAEEKGLNLASLFLEGNARLSVGEPGKPAKLALAEKVELSPSDHTILLSAAPGKKVLFWDEEQQLSISARQVKMIRDPLTGKDSVKGIGNVKFSFDAVEQSLLKKIFPFYEPPAELGDNETAI